jgi:hypothetical protein
MIIKQLHCFNNETKTSLVAVETIYLTLTEYLAIHSLKCFRNFGLLQLHFFNVEGLKYIIKLTLCF